MITVDDLRQDWSVARAALQQQLDMFQSGKMGIILADEQRRRAVTHLQAAITEYDPLLDEFQSA